MTENIIDISIIAPACNERENIKEFYTLCMAATKKIEKIIEIVFVDDGSDDGTGNVMNEIQKMDPDHITIITHLKNEGVTKSLKNGFNIARGQFIIWLPTDLESNPEEDLPKMYKKYTDGALVVAGRRENRGDGKLIASAVYNFVSRTLFSLKLKDMNWIKGFDRACLEELTLNGDMHRFILHDLNAKGYDIEEVQVNWYPRKYGVSKFGRKRFISSLVDVLGVWFILKFRDKPMRFFGTIFLLSIIIGLIMQAILTIIYLSIYTQFRPILNISFYIQAFGVVSLYTGFLAELILVSKSR